MLITPPVKEKGETCSKGDLAHINDVAQVCETRTIMKKFVGFIINCPIVEPVMPFLIDCQT